MNMAQTEAKQSKLGVLVGWVLGSLFGLTGVGTILREPVPGFIMLAMAAILIPPLSKKIETALHIRLSSSYKIPLILIGMMLFGFTITKKESLLNPDKPKVTETATAISTSSTTIPKENDVKIEPVSIIETPTRPTATTTTVQTTVPTTPATIIPTATLTPTTKEPLKLDRTYTQVINGFEDAFAFEESLLNDGRKQYLGKSDRYHAILGVVGEKRNVEEVSLMLVYSPDEPDVRLVYLLLLTQNIFPDRPDVSDWIQNSLQKIMNEYKTKNTAQVETTYDNIKITLSGVKDVKNYGLLTIITIIFKHM